MTDEQTRFPFGPDFQKAVLALMIKDPVVLVRGIQHLRAEFFTVPELSWAFSVITEYNEKYGRMVTEAVFVEELRRIDATLRLSYTTTIKGIFELDVSHGVYIKEKLLEFIQRNEFVRTWQETEALYKAGVLDDAFDHVSASVARIKAIDFSKSDRSFFFEEFKEREQIRMLEQSSTGNNNFPTGIIPLDQSFGGRGPERGELIVVFADAKKGKSIFLVNIGAACVRSFSGRVLHMQLEGSRRQTEARYDARFSDHLYTDVKRGELQNDVRQKLVREYDRLQGRLVVRGLCDFDRTILDVEAEMQTLIAGGFKPDMVIVDYGDLLSPRKGGGRGDSYSDQGAVFRDLKTFAQKHNVVVWTASQAQRPANNRVEDPEYVVRVRNIADSYNKIRVADAIMSLNQTSVEKDAGVLRIYHELYRDNEAGRLIKVHVDFKKMFIGMPRFGL